MFAASLFPVVAVPGSNLAEAQLEAEIYDDALPKSCTATSLQPLMPEPVKPTDRSRRRSRRPDWLGR